MTWPILHENHYNLRTAQEYPLFGENNWSVISDSFDTWATSVSACRSKEAVRDLVKDRWRSISSGIRPMADEIAGYDPESLVFTDTKLWYLRMVDRKYTDSDKHGSSLYIPNVPPQMCVDTVLKEFGVKSATFSEFFSVYSGVREHFFESGFLSCTVDADFIRGISEMLPSGRWRDAFPFFHALDGSNLIWNDGLGVAWWSPKDNVIRECWTTLENFVEYYVDFRATTKVFDCDSALPCTYTELTYE